MTKYCNVLFSSYANIYLHISISTHLPMYFLLLYNSWYLPVQFSSFDQTLFCSFHENRFFGSKKQKYIKTLCQFYHWVFFLVYFVEFDQFYRCFTSELHKYEWKSHVKRVPLFILVNLTNDEKSNKTMFDQNWKITLEYMNCCRVIENTLGGE